jgi:5-formyltetrahydrofolate cyclo-ligase
MKDIVRKKMLSRRNNHLKSHIFKKSAQIKNRLFKMQEFIQARTILFYISIKNEVFTHDMIRESITLGKRIIVPIADKKNNRLILSELQNWDHLKPGSYKILEPTNEHIREVSINTIDVIIIPGIAFDKFGNRIGHGMGYYDRLLSNSKNAIHIGLAFEFQLLDKFPVDDHDMRVDTIITEKRLIFCSKAK